MITIALINNMPTAAIRSTERQFNELLGTAAQDIPFCIRWFRLSGARPAGYESLETLWSSDFDGLIVTGAEPRTKILSDEIFWEPLTRTVDWAADHTRSAIWSCLAAHAAVLHLDGVARHPHDDKVFGIFRSEVIASHELLPALADWHVPHSRWNSLPEVALHANGYTVLASSPDAGVDTFVKTVGKSLFVFMQSHPEYDPGALIREYRRDLARYHLGQQDRYPTMPRNIFGEEVAAALEAARGDVAQGNILLETVSPTRSWESVAAELYRNWLVGLVRDAKTPQAVP